MSWSAPGDPAALAAHFAGWDPLISEIITAITGPGGSGFQWGMYDRAALRRERTARVQLGSRRNGAGYDSSGRELTDRRWLYDYDAGAEAAAIA